MEVKHRVQMRKKTSISARLQQIVKVFFPLAFGVMDIEIHGGVH